MRPPGSRWSSDLRHAWRAISRRPGASSATVLVLALGIGLTTAMFALADPYILRPLPYSNPDELVAITVRSDGLTRDAAIPTFDEWSARTDLFQGLAAHGGGAVRGLRYTDRSVMATTVSVTPTFFEVLGVPVPRTPDWSDPGAVPRPAVMTERMRAFLPAEALRVGTFLPGQNDDGIRVAGTTPPGFLYPDHRRSLYVVGFTSYQPGPVIQVRRWTDEGQPRSASPLQMIGRLQPGVTAPMVRGALGIGLPSGRVLEVEVVPLHEWMTRDRRSLAWGALAAGLLVLMVCAGNVANLWMARGVYRTREMATRAALGASRLDVLRLWLVETSLTAAAGSLLGLVLARAALVVARQTMPEAWATMGAPDVTTRVVFFSLLAGLIVIVIGLLPALARPGGPDSTLLTSSIVGDGGRTRVLRFTFISMQAALAMVLVVGAALLGRSYANVIAQDSGLDDGAVAVMAAYPGHLREAALEDAVNTTLRLLRLVPGVRDAAFAKGNVVDGLLRTSTHASYPLDSSGRVADARLRIVSPGYFDVAGMTLVDGRGLRQGDDARPGIVVNEAFVREYFVGQRAVGRGVGGAVVVGVVRDAYEATWVRQPEPTVYDLRGLRTGADMTLVLRVDGDPSSYRPAVHRALFETHPDTVFIEMTTFGDKLSNTVRDRSFATLVLTLFGVAGGAVTIAGLIGIVGFVVARRTREIAIRMALGAQRGHVRRLVVGEALTAAIVGGVAGVLAGRWLSTGLESFVYGVEAGDWTTTGLAGAAMLSILAVAALVPARRAVRMQPTEALRVE